MDKKQFYETYCVCCGSQRCEGIDTEWFEGCSKRWNLDGYGDAAAEIEKLNQKIMELGHKLIENTKTKLGMWRIIDRTEYGVEAECSECKYKMIFGMSHIGRYCPCCGARMDGGNK